MAPFHPAPTAWPDPRVLGSCLDEPIARRLGDGGEQALRGTLARATRTDELIVADGVAVGRVLGHGSVALYRPDPAAPLRHRLLEVDPRGVVTVVLNRGARGELREAWVSLADGGAVGVLPGGSHHPLWGPSDRLVHATAGGASTPLTLAAAVTWNAVDRIPSVAEPGRLPPGAGAALLNVLAALAWDQGRPALRYRGPYPTEQLFWSLIESFRVGPLGPGVDPRARFLADAEVTFARGAAAEAPVDWIPAPHERRVHSDGLVVQLRDGIERVTWQGRTYHRTECQGLRRREHRVVRLVEAGDGARRYLASLEALGAVVEDHLTLDDRGDPLDRHVPVPDPVRETPLAGPWREALGALLPLEATPLLTGAIAAVWPGIGLAWGPVTGDLVAVTGHDASTLAEARARLPIRVGQHPGRRASRSGAAAGPRGPGTDRPRRPRRRGRVAGGESRDAPGGGAGGSRSARPGGGGLGGARPPRPPAGRPCSRRGATGVTPEPLPSSTPPRLTER